MSAQRTIRHRHKMLKGRSYYYEYCKGGKTGYTDESQNTLVTFAEKDGMRLICVVFKEATDDLRYTDTKTLLTGAFLIFRNQQLQEVSSELCFPMIIIIIQLFSRHFH